VRSSTSRLAKLSIALPKRWAESAAFATMSVALPSKDDGASPGAG
jgi:hypothetical protein